MNPVGVTYGAELDESINVAYQNIIYLKSSAVSFKFNADDTKVVVDETSVLKPDSSSPYRETLSHFKDDQCRFALVDIPCVYHYNVQRKRLVLVSWAPSNASIQQQMMVAPTFSNLLRKCVGVAASYPIQAKSLAEARSQIKGLTDDTLLRIDGVTAEDAESFNP